MNFNPKIKLSSLESRAINYHIKKNILKVFNTEYYIFIKNNFSILRYYKQILR